MKNRNCAHNRLLLVGSQLYFNDVNRIIGVVVAGELSNFRNIRTYLKMTICSATWLA